MEECIFCKIVKGELSSKKVYEDEEFYAFEDINPQAKVHILIVPKEHYSGILECEDVECLGKLLAVGKEVARIKGIEKSGFRFVINSGPDAGQTIFHLHLHLIGGEILNPRMA